MLAAVVQRLVEWQHRHHLGSGIPYAFVLQEAGPGPRLTLPSISYNHTNYGRGHAHGRCQLQPGKDGLSGSQQAFWDPQGDRVLGELGEGSWGEGDRIGESQSRRETRIWHCPISIAGVFESLVWPVVPRARISFA